MHIAHPHKQDETESESGDSEYDTPSGDTWLPNQYQVEQGSWHRARPGLID